MKVSFANITRDEKETLIEGESVESRIRKNVLDVMNRKNFVLGDYVEEFEKAFAEYCGVKHCIGVANGLSALELALISLGIGSGDEVITVANTFNATAGAIAKTGATPVLVDADYGNYNLDIEKVFEAITRSTRAIIPVHLYGQIVEMDKLKKAVNGTPIIEDTCQAHGAKLNGKRAGSFGIAGCFSFYPGKNLGAYGDGGAITTNENGIAEFLRKTRNYGQAKKYFHEIRPDNSRLDTIQAAVLIEKLKALDTWNEMRAKNAARYRHELAGVGDIELPSERNPGEHVYHLFVIKTSKREALEKNFKENGIDSGLHYPVPIHLQNCFFWLKYKQGNFPVSEKLADNILTLPMFPTMREEELSYVSDKIKDFYKK